MSKLKEMFSGYKLTNNLSLKIVSFLFAIVVWLIVVNVGDPVTSKTYKNVPVKVLHEEFLEKEGQTYQVLDETDTVDITVRARRSVLKEIKEEDFSVTADMRELIYMESVRIDVVCGKYEDKIEAVYQSHDTLLVNVEQTQDKELQVEVETKGTPAEGYTVGKVNAAPKKLTVSGPKSVVSRVERMVATVDVDGASTDVDVEEAAVVLYDSDGTIVTDSHLSLSSSSCKVSVPIWSTKSVAVVVEPTGEVGKGYSYDKVSCYPTAVTITGEDSVLAKVTEIEIPEGVVDISGATEDSKFEINIEQYLPEGIYLVDESSARIKVTVGVSRQITKQYNIAVNQIGFLNAPEDYRVGFADVTEIQVMLRGTSGELEQMSEGDIKCTINLAGLGIGSHQVPLEIVVAGNAEVVEPVQITVYIQEKSAQSADGGTQNSTQ